MSPDMELVQALAKYSDLWVMRDLLIPAEENHSMHIDFLIVSPRCIFIGEIKTFRGNIKGNGMNKYWKQYVDNHEIDYFSPVMQNLFHMRFLREFLKPIPYDIHIHSIVYMQQTGRGGGLHIQSPYPPDTSIVTSIDALLRIAQVISEKKKMDLTPEEAKYVYDYICKHQLRGEEARALHEQQAVSYKLNARKALMQQICPECLSPLTQVATPTANYWVCSRYPDCQYSHKM